MKKRRYYVFTYDWEQAEYTPQLGVYCGPYSLFGLRRALRKLRDMGYDTGRQDSSVYVSSGPTKRAATPVGGEK